METALILCDHLSIETTGGDRKRIADHMNDITRWYQDRTGRRLEKGAG